MFRRLRSVLSVALACVIACSLFASMVLLQPPMQADAAAKAVPLSATRYRYPIIRLENAKFRNGVPIDDNDATSAYLFTGKKFNGKDPTDVIYAHVDEYDFFNMKVGKNKAFYVTSKENTTITADHDYMGYQHRFSEDVDTRMNILPESIQGIPSNAEDHGVMFHIEVKGLPGHLEDGFCHLKMDGNSISKEAYTHVPCFVNITFQEGDFKPDGAQKKKKGKLCVTAMNVKIDAEVTFIWTKQIDWVNPDKGKPQAEWNWDNVEYVREADGKPVYVKDANGEIVREEDGKTKKREIRLKPDRHHKPGDVEVIKMYQYDAEGHLNDSGAVDLPADFCGYVIVPFAQFQPCWQSDIWTDNDQMLNFKKVERIDFNFHAYPNYRGDMIFDEFCYWGPTFAKVDGAYDYGSLTIENHRDSMINRKRIRVAPEKPSEVPSVEAPSEIKKDVTLTNQDTGIVIEAPSSAKLDAKTAFNATVVNPDADDFNKQLYTRLFGADRSKFKAYTLFLGEDGDQEPADFVQINFPIPEGLDPASCKVYRFVEDVEIDKVLVESTLSADKKTLSIKTNKLETFIIAAEGKGEGPAEETTSEAAEEGSTVDAPVDSTSEADSENSSEEKTEEKSSANLLWLWIVLGVVAAGGIAVAVVLIVKKGKKEQPEDSDKHPEA